MTLTVFRLEDYMAEWEFKAPYLLCCSDAESFKMQEILDMADDQTLRLWHDLQLSYTEAPGLPALREEIAKLYQGLTVENIFCFAGAEEGILCAMQALLTADDHVIVVTPCYQALSETPQHAGAQVTTVPLSEATGWNLELDKIKSAIQPHTKMIVINFPHNPTGARLSPDKLNELVTLARKHGLMIFSDEVYRLLGPQMDDWEEPVASLYERGISLGVMSKAFGLAGLRVGWIAARDKNVIKKVEKIKHYTSICNSAPSEILAMIALRNSEQILNRNNQIVRSNILLIDQFMVRHSNLFSWVRPRGGCVGFVHYHGADRNDAVRHASDKTGAFCEKLVNDTGVFLLPGHVYSWPGNYFRIGFGRKNMVDALDRLEQYLQ